MYRVILVFVLQTQVPGYASSNSIVSRVICDSRTTTTVFRINSTRKKGDAVVGLIDMYIFPFSQLRGRALPVTVDGSFGLKCDNQSINQPMIPRLTA